MSTQSSYFDFSTNWDNFSFQKVVYRTGRLFSTLFTSVLTLVLVSVLVVAHKRQKFDLITFLIAMVFAAFINIFYTSSIGTNLGGSVSSVTYPLPKHVL